MEAHFEKVIAGVWLQLMLSTDIPKPAFFYSHAVDA